jgi:mono/diheme cytochrome c family protein
MRRHLLTLACAAAITTVAAPGYGADPDIGRGKATYGELCSKCHGGTGKGDGKEAATLATKPKDLTDCARMSGFKDDQLFRVIKEGGLAGGLSKDMPPYADALEDDEIRDTLAYIRGLCSK